MLMEIMDSIFEVVIKDVVQDLSFDIKIESNFFVILTAAVT